MVLICYPAVRMTHKSEDNGGSESVTHFNIITPLVVSCVCFSLVHAIRFPSLPCFNKWSLLYLGMSCLCTSIRSLQSSLYNSFGDKSDLQARVKLSNHCKASRCEFWNVHNTTCMWQRGFGTACMSFIVLFYVSRNSFGQRGNIKQEVRERD